MNVLRRRSFLQTVGGTFAAMPFLHLTGMKAAAQAPKKRIVILLTPNGSVTDWWFPAGGSANHLSGKALNGAFGSLPEAVRRKISVLRGIDLHSAFDNPVPEDHKPEFRNWLTGRQATRIGGAAGSEGDFEGSGISLDQHIANSLGDVAPVKSLYLGARGGGHPPVFRAALQPLQPENNPLVIRDRIFRDAPGGSPAPMEDPNARRRSVLDSVAGELGRVRCEVTGDERQQLERHLEQIRSLEESLDSPEITRECAAPPLGTFDFRQDGDINKIMRAQFDLLSAAFACDLTRVGVVLLGGRNFTFPWTGFNGRGDGWHGIIHGGPSDKFEQEGKITSWIGSEVARFLTTLDGYREGSNTILDNTVFIWIHEQARASSHQRRDYPILMAGSCGGYLKTGRTFDFRTSQEMRGANQWDTRRGRNHNDLLLTLAHAMGLRDTSFGDPRHCTGDIGELVA